MPKINTAYVFDVGLTDQSNTKLLKADPTLASGDVKVSVDEGAFSNLSSLPATTPAAGKNVKVSLTAAEMNGNRIIVLFSDAAGAEWCDLLYVIETSPDDLTISGVADGVWDEPRSSHVTSGSFGEGTVHTSDEREAIADALLTRDMSDVTGEASRSPINALRFNRNKFVVDGNILTVYKEDDTTVAWTANLAGITDFDVDPS